MMSKDMGGIDVFNRVVQQNYRIHADKNVVSYPKLRSGNS